MLNNFANFDLVILRMETENLIFKKHGKTRKDFKVNFTINDKQHNFIVDCTFWWDTLIEENVKFIQDLEFHKVWSVGEDGSKIVVEYALDFFDDYIYDAVESQALEHLNKH